MNLRKILIAAFVAVACILSRGATAFVAPLANTNQKLSLTPFISLNAHPKMRQQDATDVFEPLRENGTRTSAIAASKAAVAAAFATVMMSPLYALAEEDDYEYGAVNAPGGLSIAVVGGLLAILTALLPVFLKGGEEAFEEMKERDDFGRSGDALNKKKK